MVDMTLFKAYQNPKAVRARMNIPPRGADRALTRRRSRSNWSQSNVERVARATGQWIKRIADGDSDGRVTPYEFRSALAFIVARWRPASADSGP